MTLCATRPAEWWETGDEGNRLAMLLCRSCPSRRGDECCAGLPDPRPHGVVRAGVAYSDAGKPLPVCECGYPNVSYRGGPVMRCARCVPPRKLTDVEPVGLAEVDEAVVERWLDGNPPAVIRPVDKRETLRRLWAAGLSHREVAIRLGLNIKAVRRAHHRMTRRAA